MSRSLITYGDRSRALKNMQWTDEAIILSTKKYGENSALLKVLAREHGLFAGVIRGVNSKNNRGIAQSGNITNCTWQARLSQQLGTFKLELTAANTAHIMNNAAKLAATSSICVIIESAFAERHPYPKLFYAFNDFLHLLTTENNWLHEYIKLEMTLLSESGFGLDLSSCAASGTTENLIYVSPKSGRAVCADAGEPYKNKLLPLPNFLLSSPNPKPLVPNHDYKETLAGMRLTGYFLEHWLLEPHGKPMPATRSRLRTIIQKQIGKDAR
ncbi:MAG: DNA repair protein RecO [Rickettsiales bacterium]